MVADRYGRRCFTDVGLLAGKGRTTERDASEHIDRVRRLNKVVVKKGLTDLSGGTAVAAGQEGLELIDEEVGLVVRQALDYTMLARHWIQGET